MTTFSAAKKSESDIPYPREAVWDVLSDPALVGRLTPFVRRIEGHGSHWLWHLTSIPVLGKPFALSFTERMAFTPQHSIDFTHDPGSNGHGATERAGADGGYRLVETDTGTQLSIDLSVHVDLPFPRLARPAVQGTMQAVLAAMGAGFARSLDQHLAKGTRTS